MGCDRLLSQNEDEAGDAWLLKTAQYGRDG